MLKYSAYKLLCCLSSAIFKVPLMKHVLTWVGATSADKQNMTRYLQSGISLNICSGGVAEVEYADHDDGIVRHTCRYL